MTDIATMNRIEEILAEYQSQKAELLATDLTEQIEQQVALFREKLTAEWANKIANRVRELDISILAVERVKAKLLIEEEVENATTEQSDFAISESTT